jgi:hypothetical protein
MRKLVFLKIAGHGELRITMVVSVLTDMRIQTPFIVLKRKNLRTGKLPGRIG